MDENRNDHFGEDNDAYTDSSGYGGDEAYGYDEPLDYEGDELERTQVMNSIQLPKLAEEQYGITPRDEFTVLNAADDFSQTRAMDSLPDTGMIPDEPLPVEGPVKKRSKKKNKINHTKTMGQVFLGVLISVTAICIGVFLSVKVIGAMRDITGMAKSHKEIDLEITEDMSVEQIVESLHENGIIEMPSLMKMYINFTKNKDGFLNGPHTINSNMSYNNIIASLKTEKEFTSTIEVVIPEGLTVIEIGQLLEENYVCRASDFEAYVKTKHNLYDFEEGIGSASRLFMLEGYLFPDTYEFYVVDYLKKNPNYDTSTWAKQAADKMMDNFDDRITKRMKARMKELGLTLDETLTLASLIQREGIDEENMAMVSSVFHNRLNNPETFPQLQSDTTYTYINECIKARTTPSNAAAMQKLEEAYDSYNEERVGLPVGAICNPGLDAINAALYPASTNYFFFLSARDGTFYWATTQEQHEQNILDAAINDDLDDEDL